MVWLSSMTGGNKSLRDELRTQLIIATELGEISQSDTGQLLAEAEVISKMLYRLGQSQRSST